LLLWSNGGEEKKSGVGAAPFLHENSTGTEEFLYLEGDGEPVLHFPYKTLSGDAGDETLDHHIGITGVTNDGVQWTTASCITYIDTYIKILFIDTAITVKIHT
jgi:hypothetical protein